jgi:hypothetical protein
MNRGESLIGMLKMRNYVGPGKRFDTPSGISNQVEKRYPELFHLV